MRRYRALTGILAVLVLSAAAYALTVTSRTQVINGLSVGEVVVDSQVPLRIRFSAGGLSPSERADIVARRMSVMQDLEPTDITVGRVRGQWAVLARGQLLVTADPAHALANDTTPYGLALAWRNQLRSAVAGQSVTPPVGAGPGEFVNTAQRVVPIISVGSGLRVGAAVVTGSSAQVDKVNAVAQVEGQFADRVRVRALVPIDTENVIGRLRRVPGTAVTAVADIRL